MLIVVPLQLLIYLVLLATTALYLAFCWIIDRHLDVWHRGAAFGLLASPLGFILPYVVSIGCSFLIYGSDSPSVIANGQSILALLAFILLLLGPLLGPPVITILVAAWYVRRRKLNRVP